MKMRKMRKNINSETYSSTENYEVIYYFVVAYIRLYKMEFEYNTV